MTIKLDEIKLIIFPGSCPPQAFLAQYNQAYECWREVWTGFLRDMNSEEALFSDIFTRQDEIIALYYKDECAALLFSRKVDFNLSTIVHDSCFQIWPEYAIKKLCAQGKKILLLSQLTIKEKFRKDFHGILLKDLLFGLCYERFLPSDCDSGATAVRKKKRMDETVSKLNGTPIVQDLHYRFDQTVDLVGFFRDKICPSKASGIAKLAQEIYSNKISLVDLKKTKKEDKYAA